MFFIWFISFLILGIVWVGFVFDILVVVRWLCMVVIG